MRINFFKISLSVFLLFLFSCKKEIGMNQVGEIHESPLQVFDSPRAEAAYWFEQQVESFGGSPQSQYYLEKSLKADPTYARAWNQMAQPHLRKGEFAKGFKMLDEAVRLNKLEFIGLRGCAKLYYLHDSDGALKDLIELDSMTPNFTDAPWGKDIYYHMGIAEKLKGNLNGALNYFDFSISNTTKERGEDWVDVKVFLYRGLVHMEVGNYELALKDFDKGILYFDKFTEAYFYKGQCYIKLNDRVKACEYFNKAKYYFEAGYTYSNQMYAMTEEVLFDDILEQLKLFCD